MPIVTTCCWVLGSWHALMKSWIFATWDVFTGFTWCHWSIYSLQRQDFWCSIIVHGSFQWHWYKCRIRVSQNLMPLSLGSRFSAVYGVYRFFLFDDEPATSGVCCDHLAGRHRRCFKATASGCSFKHRWNCPEGSWCQSNSTTWHCSFQLSGNWERSCEWIWTTSRTECHRNSQQHSWPYRLRVFWVEVSLGRPSRQSWWPPTWCPASSIHMARTWLQATPAKPTTTCIRTTAMIECDLFAEILARSTLRCIGNSFKHLVAQMIGVHQKHLVTWVVSSDYGKPGWWTFSWVPNHHQRRDCRHLALLQSSRSSQSTCKGRRM